MAKNLRSIEPSEHQIQAAIVEWANKTFIEHPMGWQACLGSYLIAYPNGGSRKKRISKKGKIYSSEGMKLKREGVKKGVSDLFLAVPAMHVNLGRKKYGCGLWMEVKKKGKLPREEQYKWLESMSDIGYGVAICDTVDKGIQAIKDYLGMK